jgi:hypothetical protein
MSSAPHLGRLDKLTVEGGLVLLSSTSGWNKVVLQTRYFHLEHFLLLLKLLPLLQHDLQSVCSNIRRRMQQLSPFLSLCAVLIV